MREQGRRSLAGVTIALNGRVYPVIGEMPRDVRYPYAIDAWLSRPASADAANAPAFFWSVLRLRHQPTPARRVQIRWRHYGRHRQARFRSSHDPKLKGLAHERGHLPSGPDRRSEPRGAERLLNGTLEQRVAAGREREGERIHASRGIHHEPRRYGSLGGFRIARARSPRLKIQRARVTNGLRWLAVGSWFTYQQRP